MLAGKEASTATVYGRFDGSLSMSVYVPTNERFGSSFYK